MASAGTTGRSFHHLEGDGITGRVVQSIYEDSHGHIWCGGQHTLGYYDGAIFHDVAPRIPRSGIPHCWGITQDLRGHLWIGAEFPIRFDGESFHRYTEDDGFSRAHRSYLVSTDHAVPSGLAARETENGSGVMPTAHSMPWLWT